MKRIAILVLLAACLAVLGLTVRTNAQNSSQPLFETVGGSAPVATAIPYHIITGTVTLSGGAATITFTGNGVFTSTTSFGCAGTDQTAANAVRLVPASASTVTVAGTTTDVVYFVCQGN
jgi:hypothetical protein